jgi:diguanylate cyclase (GGDEF)-like protein
LAQNGTVIGQLSSDAGITLVGPAYFVCAGILLYTAITAAIVGLYRGRVPLYLAFAATCLSSAGVAVSIASGYSADSVGGAVEASRWGSAWGDLFLGSLVAFIAIYTGVGNRKPLYLAIAFATATLLAADFLSTYGQRFSGIEGYRWIHMPWGESLFFMDGRVSAWNVGFRLLSLATVAWSVWRLLELHRRGKRRDAAVLAAYLVIVFAASIHGALIDLGLVHTFHSVPIALVGLAMLMSVNLAMQIREQNLALEATAGELRNENELRRVAEARIRERAYVDALTGLPNRALLQERLSSLIGSGPADGVAHGGVLICDLDHFKVINNALSHEVGDLLLREIATRMADAAGSEAVIARLSGNTFAAVLAEMHPQELDARARIGALADRISEEVARTIHLGEHSIDLTTSIGLATFPSQGITPNDVIGRADLALHRAKRRGRSIIQPFVPAFRDEIDERFRVVDGLRRAVAAGELALHYQPQVDLAGRVIGAEALMRWSSATMGAVSPATFIPAAEETGLIHSLGEWSLEVGCARLAAWKREGVGFDGHLSINVSPWQLARHEFVERLVAIVESSGVDPHQLTLEITESAVLFDAHETMAKLREIRPIGVRIALDDFGTGYSSLALIKDLPLDAIKIDQSFVRHLEQGANKHLIQVVVAIGSALGLEIIAEGVESQAERDVLASLGCTHMQGYYYARPMPEREFVDWLRARRAGRPAAKTLSF